MSTRHLWQLIAYRSQSELLAEAHRTYAGFLWWMIEPLVSLGVYFFVFGLILQNKTPDFAVFLFAGILSWRWFQSCVTRCSTSLISSRPLMQLVYVRKELFPCSMALADSVKFLFTLPMLLIALWITDHPFGIATATLPLVIINQFLLICAAGILCAAITPFFPDFQVILSTFLQLAVFVSGVFYDVGKLPEDAQYLLQFNPMVIIIEQFRGATMYNTFPDWNKMGILYLETAVLLVIGLALIRRYDKTYPKLW